MYIGAIDCQAAGVINDFLSGLDNAGVRDAGEAVREGHVLPCGQTPLRALERAGGLPMI